MGLLTADTNTQKIPRLWEGLAEGALQTIATDHCPFLF